MRSDCGRWVGPHVFALTAKKQLFGVGYETVRDRSSMRVQHVPEIGATR